MGAPTPVSRRARDQALQARVRPLAAYPLCRRRRLRCLHERGTPAQQSVLQHAPARLFHHPDAAQRGCAAGRRPGLGRDARPAAQDLRGHAATQTRRRHRRLRDFRRRVRPELSLRPPASRRSSRSMSSCPGARRRRSPSCMACCWWSAGSRPRHDFARLARRRHEPHRCADSARVSSCCARRAVCVCPVVRRARPAGPRRHRLSCRFSRPAAGACLLIADAAFQLRASGRSCRGHDCAWRPTGFRRCSCLAPALCFCRSRSFREPICGNTAATTACATSASAIMLLFAAIVLVLIAGDALSFLVAWELMSIFSYLLVTYDLDREGSAHGGFVMLALGEAGTIAVAIALLLIMRRNRNARLRRSAADPASVARGLAGRCSCSRSSALPSRRAWCRSTVGCRWRIPSRRPMSRRCCRP